MGQRISANLSEQLVEELKEIAKRRGVSMTEVLRQALSTEFWIDEEQERGSKILVETPEKEVRRVVFQH